MKIIFLMILGYSWLMCAEVFVDKSTGLTWQDNEDAKTVRKDWQGAKDYCENLTIAGYEDWKLPDKATLRVLYPKKQYLNNVDSFPYWSLSSDNAEYAEGVDFSNGYFSLGRKTHKVCVRCVRGDK